MDAFLQIPSFSRQNTAFPPLAYAVLLNILDSINGVDLRYTICCGNTRRERRTEMRVTLLKIFAGVLMVLVGIVVAHSADTVAVTGEIIDTYCYVLMGAKGASHRQCAIDCVKKGIPAGLLEDGTNKVYVLLPNKDKSPLPPAVIDKMAQKVTVTGKVVTSGGSQFLTIDSIK
jgi:hypothetical protein